MSERLSLRGAIATVAIQVATLMAVLVAVLVATGLPLPATAADTAQEVSTFRNRVTGRCLDDSGSGLRTFTCKGLNSQKWNITTYDKGLVLANHETKRCVDDSSAGLRSFTCNGLRLQRWY